MKRVMKMSRVHLSRPHFTNIESLFWLHFTDGTDSFVSPHFTDIECNFFIFIKCYNLRNKQKYFNDWTIKKFFFITLLKSFIKIHFIVKTKIRIFFKIITPKIN